mgnify:CR=1 FL=1
MDILNQPKGFVLDQDKGYFQNAGADVKIVSLRDYRVNSCTACSTPLP